MSIHGPNQNCIFWFLNNLFAEVEYNLFVKFNLLEFGGIKSFLHINERYIL